jgi:hypothetical protein
MFGDRSTIISIDHVHTETLMEKSIKALCKMTIYHRLCVSSLSSYSMTILESHKFVKVVVQFTIVEAQKCFNLGCASMQQKRDE